MGKTRILILLVAAVAGGAAFFLVSTGQSPKEVVQAIPVATAKQDTVRVLVAAANIQQGRILDAKQTQWIEWPKSSVPSFYITEKNNEFVEALDQMRARRTIHENEAIYADNVVRHGDRGMLAAIMTPGMRAVTAKVTAEQASGGFILPGDRVDVYVSGSARGDSGDNQSFASILLTDVRVLAIDQLTQAIEDEAAIVGRTVTLEVTPDQARLFLQARESQTVSIVLRGIGEASSFPSMDTPRPDEVIVLRYGQG